MYISSDDIYVCSLVLETHSIDLPLTRKVYSQLKDLGARFPNVIKRREYESITVNYLSHIAWKSFSKFEMNSSLKEALNNNDSQDCLFQLEPPLGASRYAEYFSFGDFHILLDPSELSKNGQLAFDFPVHVMLQKPDRSLKCKFSDFLSSLECRLKFEHTSLGHTASSFEVIKKWLPFNANSIVSQLLEKGLMDKENLELDPQMLVESYRVVTMRKEGESILSLIVNDIRDEVVEIGKKKYLIADLIIMCFGRGLLELDFLFRYLE
ncbi:predicted protein [Naegleria gruberi]|uniref:Predicted protein n=1 Tax=Naegleria gruberi TaxID=5762 RepID=D2VYI7_NAEGR|nr:uncharacterized protein NAEGRDRAFT_74135 [Naegleria gruberi]EFC38118.1 predicted protein [Naegleria gruberi]|eukprot:XP_002670862.1 predicted protein [Naegleria gruberi strain NEG-M]